MKPKVSTEKTPADKRLNYKKEDGRITEEGRQRLLKALEPFRKGKKNDR